MAVLTSQSDPNISPEVSIVITVPEVFLGCSISELNARRGTVTGIYGNAEEREVHGVIRAAEFDHLSAFIAEATQNRGRVERKD